MPWKIKIVRDESPNEDGRWIALPEKANPVFGHGWIVQENSVKEYIPKGHHMVSLERV